MLIDLIGNKFGRLLVLQRAQNDKWSCHRWLCQCDCKNIKTIRGSDLQNGKTKSCGCLSREKIVAKSTKHGHAKRTKISNTYMSWYNMVQRCSNPNHRSYSDYGGRGIKICERWTDSFQHFLDDMGERPKGKSIDRINNDGIYCKGNCKWSTKLEQNRNSRHNRLVEFAGKIQCVAAWAEDIGVSWSVIRWRISNGWSIKKTMTTPVGKWRK